MTDPPRIEPLEAHTFNEVCYYLAVTSCQACGKGPWEIDHSELPDPATRTTTVEAHCRNCAGRRSFAFTCRHDSPREGPEAETINPLAEPSRIIDLAQWLSLFYLLAESAAADAAPTATRQKGYQMALCLAEALKFYGDDELPPESAFFTAATADIFRRHPERFARQKLRDIQAKLPSLSAMAQRLDRERRATKKRWWRFWQK